MGGIFSLNGRDEKSINLFSRPSLKGRHGWEIYTRMEKYNSNKY